jgi:hypothetical protein
MQSTILLGLKPPQPKSFYREKEALYGFLGLLHTMRSLRQEAKPLLFRQSAQE